jgi:hypothetical protein
MPAVSKKQQRFFGMVRAAQKGEMKNPSSEVLDVADDISVKDAKKFAKTKHKGLPEKKMSEENLNELVGGAGTLVRQGIKVGGKKGGRAVQQGQSAAIKAGQGAKAKVAQGNQSKMVGSGKWERRGATVGGLVGGIAGGIADGPLPVGDIVGGIAGSKLGGKIGRQLDKRSIKKENYSDWRNEFEIVEGNPFQKIRDTLLPPRHKSASPCVRSGKCKPGPAAKAAIDWTNKKLKDINTPIKNASQTIKTVKSAANTVKSAAKTVKSAAPIAGGIGAGLAVSKGVDRLMKGGKKTNEDVDYKSFIKQAQAAREKVKKKVEDRKKKDSQFVDTKKYGVKFYDKKGSGRIVKGKKIYS